MTEHPLDRPVFASLNSLHGPFSAGTGAAKRFIPQVGPLTGLRDETDQSLQDLTDLLHQFGSAVIAQAPALPCPPNALVKAQMPAQQMVYEPKTPVSATPALIEKLPPCAAPSMLSLAKLTNPGPFAERTHELGTFWGIHQDGKLAAMAGERLKLPGYVEVSGVCTDPDFEGRGYGKALCIHVCNAILAQGETPFLHVFADNHRAIRLYEHLGFVTRTQITVTVLDPADPEPQANP